MNFDFKINEGKKFTFDLKYKKLADNRSYPGNLDVILKDEQGDKNHILEKIYFKADSLETLREAMYAGKYVHKTDGTFKLVFYPAMGQTEPPK